jgi:hypothetical protein
MKSDNMVDKVFPDVKFIFLLDSGTFFTIRPKKGIREEGREGIRSSFLEADKLKSPSCVWR